MRPIEIPYYLDPYIPILGISHSFLCVNADSGQKLGGFSGEGAPSSDSRDDPDARCKRQPPPPGDKDNCFDNCVLEFITSKERPRYFYSRETTRYSPHAGTVTTGKSLATHTCHQYVADVLSRCQTRCRGEIKNNDSL